MTLKEVIGAADALKPNAFTNDQKTDWINTLEGRIQADVWLRDPDEIIRYTYAADQDTELLLPPPHDDLYSLYLQAMIDFGNGEYAKYQNTMQMYNAAFNNYAGWFISKYDPAQAGRAMKKLGSVTYLDAGEAVSLYSLPPGALLMRVGCVIDTVFDGSADVLTLGTAADADALLAAEVTPQREGAYYNSVYLSGGVSGLDIQATLTSDATQGAASFYGLVLEPRY